MKPDLTQIKIKALDETLLKRKPVNIKPQKLYYMAQSEKQEQKQKTYTEKELKKALNDQKEAIKQRIKQHNSDSLHKQLVLNDIEQV
ncbi:MAG: hypothetical protein KGY70_18660 [Bacteroidales bacterium]|nr:hypothetical protein [Bacteroidales bacterium]